jgi:uncharacterized protein
MRMRHTALLLGLLLVSCGSSPKTHFYTLDAVPPGQATARPAHISQPIQVGHVDLPGTLDRLPVVTRASGDRLNVSDQDRWAAPLDELIRRALTQDLRKRLSPGDVLAPGDPSPPNARTLTLNVQQFMVNESGQVEFDVDWALQQNGKPGTTRHEMIQTDAGSQNGEAVAAAMSRAVGELADRISAAL